MRFLVDMPLSPRLAAWLIGQGHDAIHTAQIGLHRAMDEEIIDRARSESRIIVTADVDYPRLLAMEQVISPGLICSEAGISARPNAFPGLSVHWRMFRARNSRIPSSW